MLVLYLFIFFYNINYSTNGVVDALTDNFGEIVEGMSGYIYNSYLNKFISCPYLDSDQGFRLPLTPYPISAVTLKSRDKNIAFDNKSRISITCPDGKVFDHSQSTGALINYIKHGGVNQFFTFHTVVDDSIPFRMFSINNSHKCVKAEKELYSNLVTCKRGGEQFWIWIPENFMSN
ncbi:hypothetical protein CDIK_2555 [Cucumispora dikerogammari]|nr:hypothetical protein CDIK_2555 [Cucumispora dikerogammari]